MSRCGPSLPGGRWIPPLLVLALFQVGASLSHLVWMSSGSPVWLLGDTYLELREAEVAAQAARPPGHLSDFLLALGPYDYLRINPGPLVHLVTGWLMQAWGQTTYWVPWLVMQGSSFLLGVSALALGSRFGAGPALLAGVLTLLCPALIMEGKRFQLDIPSAALAVLGLAGWLASDRLTRRAPALLGALALGLAVLAKLYILLVIAPISLFFAASLRSRPASSRLVGLALLAAPLLLGAWRFNRYLQAAPDSVGCVTGGTYDPLFMVIQLTVVGYHTLLGPPLSVLVALAGVHHLRRGRWWAAGLGVALVLPYCSLNMVKGRHLLFMLPLLMVGLALWIHELRTVRARVGVGLATALIALVPWSPPRLLLVLDVSRSTHVDVYQELLDLVPTDSEFGMPDPEHVPLGFCPTEAWSGWSSLLEDPGSTRRAWFFPPLNGPGARGWWDLRWHPVRVEGGLSSGSGGRSRNRILGPVLLVDGVPVPHPVSRLMPGICEEDRPSGPSAP